jgi:hypothetical protein
MPKIILFSCLLSISTTQLRAQTKDTIRENVNYRLYHSLRQNRIKESIQPKQMNNQSYRSSQSEVLKNKKDTVRKKKNYRIDNSFKIARNTPHKVYSHFLGIQTNHMLRLLSDHNNGSILLSNPYGFTYTFNHAQTGYGLGFGLGYVYSLNKTTVSGIQTAESAQNKTSFRIGPQKQKSIGKRWTVGTGVDLLFSRGNAITKNFVGGLIQESTQKKVSLGLGPRATVQYAVWNKIKMGTELCGYFQNLKTTDREEFTGLPAETSRSNSTSTAFILPVSLFIAVGIW